MTSIRGNEMLSYLPQYYEKSRVVYNILETEGLEFDATHQRLKETLDQFFVQTATWGLGKWESQLEIEPPIGATHTERREKIIAKIRGVGTATIAVIKRTAEAYDQGAVDVYEDHPAYKITLVFIDTTGVPPNLQSLLDAVRDVVPAHLEMAHRFNYFLWDELDSRGWTWTVLDTMTITWDQIIIAG